jgi:hypothetical protein
MVINTTLYNDFKIVADKITPDTPRLLRVFANTQGEFWFAWAIIEDIAVTISLQSGEPESFATDFPDNVTIENTISIQ